jgi:hypothetical protein
MKILRHFPTKQNQNGFMSAEWSAAVAFLLIPAFIVSFSMLQLPARKNLSQVASTAAARAYVQVLDQSQAEAAARAAAVEAISAELIGTEPNAADYSDVDKYNERLEQYNENRAAFFGDPLDPDSGFKGEIDIEFNLKGDGYCPGDEVQVIVSLPFPLLINPFQSGGDPFSGIGSSKISSSSTERISDYGELTDSETGPALPGGYDEEEGRCDAP